MPAKTPLIAVFSVLCASILGAAGQFLFQHGARTGQSGVLAFLRNPYILIGMTTYIAVMALFTYAFRVGGTVRALYPLYASTFIWAALFACLRYGQTIQPIHMAGMLLLVVGMLCMSW